MIGIDVVLVVGLAQVDGTHILPIDVMADGLIGLQVHIDATGEYHVLQRSILDAAIEIIRSATNLECLVLQVRLQAEELVRKVVLMLKLL